MGALAALMLLAAFTEGFGLLLLVPMLGSLGAGQAAGGGLAPLLDSFGITQEPGPLLALFVALVVLRAVIGHYRTLAALRFEIALVDGTRRRAWNALLHCDWRVLSNMRQSESASLLITSIDRMGLGVNQILAAATTSITLVAIGLAALAIAPGLALGAGIGGIVVMFAYRRMRRHAGLLGEQLGAAYADVYGHLQELLGALRVIKSFGREDLAESNIADAFTNLRKAQLGFLRDQGLGRIALQGGGALLLALLVWLAITRWNMGAATILPMVALFARALPLLGALQEAWQNWEHARPAIDEALALIEQTEAAREPDADATEAPTLRQAITLSGVTVRFTGRAIAALVSVDLAIPANGLIALTGPSGAGKSTLADLLGGLIAPSVGSIAIDGVQLDDSARLAWRRRVAYVQQEPVLFSGTIRENLLWAMPEASEEQLWQVLRDASAMFVENLPEKLDATARRRRSTAFRRRAPTHCAGPRPAARPAAAYPRRSDQRA